MAKQEKPAEKLVLAGLQRLNAKVKGSVIGILAGLGLFIATNWLVLKGGDVVGPHLGLLGQLFIGYRVTFVGSVIGFAYAFICGFVIGYAVASLYNWIADLREGNSRD